MEKRETSAQGSSEAGASAATKGSGSNKNATDKIATEEPKGTSGTSEGSNVVGQKCQEERYVEVIIPIYVKVKIPVGIDLEVPVEVEAHPVHNQKFSVEVSNNAKTKHGKESAPKKNDEPEREI